MADTYATVADPGLPVDLPGCEKPGLSNAAPRLDPAPAGTAVPPARPTRVPIAVVVRFRRGRRKRHGTSFRTGVSGRVGFQSGSEVYERARPGYPDEAVSHLEAVAGLGTGSRILDIAAGTGKLTRKLVTDGIECVAVEPSASMRAEFRRCVPGTPVVAGVAESIPVRDSSFDAAVVAQAFHWFEPEVALPEVARVLRSGGWLALIRNERDESDPLVAELVHRSKWTTGQPEGVSRDFGADLEKSGLFGPVDRTRYSFVQHLDIAGFVEQVASRSYVRVLPDARRHQVLATVRELGASVGEPIPLPYTSDLFCAPVREEGP